jgi:Ca2+-binding EF-hand superfamily protein
MSTTEMKRILVAVGSILKEDEINEMLTEADVHGTGSIDYTMFVDVLMSLLL